MRSTLTLGLAVLAALAVAGPTTAQLTEKEAVKQVKSSAKAQLKAFKQKAAAALSTLDANLQTAEDLITPSSFPEDVISQVAVRSIEYMTALNEAFADSKGQVESGAVLALEAMADGGDLQGLYPTELYYGSGGVLDKHRAALIKAGIKSRDAAVKLLVKVAALSEKEANIALTFELRFPTRTEPLALDQAGQLGLSQTATIDVIVAASDLDYPQDGLLYFGGMTGDEIDNVAVAFFGGDGVAASDDVAPEVGTGRFHLFFAGLPEGGYVVDARQGTGGTNHSVGEIGVR